MSQTTLRNIAVTLTVYALFSGSPVSAGDGFQPKHVWLGPPHQGYGYNYALSGAPLLQGYAPRPQPMPWPMVQVPGKAVLVPAPPPPGFIPHGTPLPVSPETIVDPNYPRVLQMRTLIQPEPHPHTLGTYTKRTLPVPDDEHPRVGILIIELPESHYKIPNDLRVNISVIGLKQGYVDDDKRWHFESKALLPGNPHVYTLKVERVRVVQKVEIRDGKEIVTEIEKPHQLIGVSTVRLIPGRIVEVILF